MRYIQVILLFLFISCSSEPECKTCATVTSSDRLAQLGLANNGFDEEDRVSLGTLCGSSLEAAESIPTETETVTSTDQNGDAYTYTVRVVTECE